MFLGHWAVGLGAKRLAPRTSLGTLFLAAQWVDLIWPTFLLLGWEAVRIDPGATRVTPLDFVRYPWTHSLATGIGWGALLAGLHFAARRSARAALAVGGAVASHWLLDAAVHRPDLPLTPAGAARAGLGLWNSPVATLALELGLLAAGALLYARATRPRDRAGRLGFAALLGFLVAVYAVNLLGPPPPDARAIAVAGHAQWLIVAAAAWLDRHREPVGAVAEGARLARAAAPEPG
jgi:hypothetical protein